MKIAYLRLSLVFFYNPISRLAQTFSLTELISFTSKNLDGFDTYVTAKGFKFLELREKENEKGNTYCLNQSKTSIKNAEKFITYDYVYYDADRNVTFQTANSNDYLKLKAQVIPYGFKFTNTETFKGATVLYYRKGKLELTLISYQNKTESGKVGTNYEISIT